MREVKQTRREDEMLLNKREGDEVDREKEVEREKERNKLKKVMAGINCH